MATRTEAPDPTVSVVIPSYNSRETILDCLRAVLEQDGVQPDEVIVVDSSADGTADAIRDAFPEPEFPALRLVRLEKRTHAGPGRNIGALAASGDILAFTDADCRPSKDWLLGVLRAQAKTAAPAVVAGAIDNGTPESLVGTADWLIEFSNAFPGLPGHEVSFAATANLALPRETFLSTEGFDDSRTGQDMVFGETLRREGHRVRFDPDIRVAHRNRVKLGHFFRRQFDLGRGSARIRRRLPLGGAWIVRFPFLVPLLVPYRGLQVARRALRSGGPRARALLKTAPLVALGLTAWTAGFLTGTIERLPNDSRSKTESCPT